MASRTGPGQPGHNPIIAVIAMVVFAPYVDRTWLAILLDMTVLYGLGTDCPVQRPSRLTTYIPGHTIY